MEAKMQKEEQSHKQNYDLSTERRIYERRVKGSAGFTYITIVGWICRRENIRRKGNNFLFKKRL
jgi:hypothetical protein